MNAVKSHDDLAVAIWRSSSNIGHVPREFSQVCWYFLQKSGSEITCSRQKWQEVKVYWVTRMCVYVFRDQRKPNYLSLKAVLQTIHGLLYAIYLFCACALEIFLEGGHTGHINKTNLPV